jgi:hypothetical protein
MNRRQRWGVFAGLVLLLAYAVPLFFPPAESWAEAALPAAGFWERLFPGVPPTWVVSRLLCLLSGAGLLAWSLRAHLPLALGESTAAPRVARTAQMWALVLALAQASCGLFAAHFNRLGETVYFLFLAVPAAVLLVAEGDAGHRAWCSLARRSLPLLLIPALWLAWSIPTAWRSPRAGSLVDMWIMVERLEEVARGDHHILADSASPGHTNAYMMLEGASFVGPDRPPTFVQLQIAHLFWAVVCALALGAIVRQMVSQPAAIVAQAVLLFSQYVLASPYSPGFTLIAPLCATVLLLLVLAVRQRGSAAALAAFGAVAGFSSTEPTVILVTLLLCAVMAYSVTRFSPLPWLVVAVAALSALAAVLPDLPNPETLAAMAHQYTVGRRQLVGMVMILFGQRTPYVLMDTLNAGRPGPLDLVAGALLAPFAIARTPHRLWGDALLDPFGAVLMAAGLALSTLHVTRNRAALLVLSLLATGLAHAFTSSGDAVSHGRLAAALLPLAVCAAVGFEALRLAFAPALSPRLIAAVSAALIALGGSAVFETVNRRILPASWLTISLEALATSEPPIDAVFLEHDGPWNLSWLYVRHIAALVPRRPVPVYTFSEFERTTPTTADAAQRVYFWSPGLEQDAAVSHAICKRWPGAALYTLTDQPGAFRAFAAAPRGDIWHPALANERWTMAFCPGSQH